MLHNMKKKPLALHSHHLSPYIASCMLIFIGQIAHAKSITVSGDIIPKQPPTEPFWDIKQNLTVGNKDHGSMSITGGAEVKSGNGDIGYFAGSSGEVSISGAGSQWTNHSLAVGTYGKGTLAIEDGAVISSTDSLVGMGSGAEGHVTVSGEGSQWINRDGLIIAHSDESKGTLIIEDGGLVKATNVVLGYTKNAEAHLELRTGGVLEINQLQNLGYGNAENLILDGGTLRARKNMNNFLARFDQLNLEKNGLILDSNGFDIGVYSRFSGDGAMTKQGAGTLSLTGDSNYSGGTFIENGKIAAGNNGALGIGDVFIGGKNHDAILQINRDISLKNQAVVDDRGLLIGHGGIGQTTVKRGGTIAPGLPDNLTGTITVNGDLTFEQGSNYEVYAEPTSDSNDLIIVNGKANLNGNIIYRGLDDNFANGKKYTILTAKDGITGTFSSVEDTFAFLDLAAIYNADSVDLTLLRNTTGFSDLALTPNQKAVAKDVEKKPTSDFIYQFVLGLQDGQAPDAFDSLSGEIHANLQHYLANMGNQIAFVKSRNFYNDLPFWAEMTANQLSINGDGNAAKLKQNSGNVYMGMNQQLGDRGWRLGEMIGYSNAELKSNERYSSADIDSYSFTLYTGKAFKHQENLINFLAGMSYARHQIKTNRNVPLLEQNLHADYSADVAQLFSEAGYAFKLNDSHQLEPFINLTVENQHISRFQEHGGEAALHASSSNDTRTGSTLGLKTSSLFALENKNITVSALFGWRHGWGDLDLTRSMSFSDNTSNFTIAGVPLAKDTALVGLQTHIAYQANTHFTFGYSGDFGKNTQDQNIYAKVNWSF